LRRLSSLWRGYHGCSKPPDENKNWSELFVLDRSHAGFASSTHERTTRKALAGKKGGEEIGHNNRMRKREGLHYQEPVADLK